MYTLVLFLRSCNLHTDWLGFLFALVYGGHSFVDPTALRCTHKEGIIDTLDRMNKGLEMIQKSLDDYLEKKRQAFPRFYFLSSEDLLEILGQSRGLIFFI